MLGGFYFGQGYFGQGAPGIVQAIVVGTRIIVLFCTGGLSPQLYATNGVDVIGYATEAGSLTTFATDGD